PAPATQVVPHGLGAAPRALVFWTLDKTDEAIGAGYELSYGFADGDAGFAMGAASAGGADPTNTTRRVALAPISIVQPGEVIDSEATVIAWDATTFTLRWDFNRSTPAVVHFIAVGGSSVRAKVVSWRMPTVLG